MQVKMRFGEARNGLLFGMFLSDNEVAVIWWPVPCSMENVGALTSYMNGRKEMPDVDEMSFILKAQPGFSAGPAGVRSMPAWVREVMSTPYGEPGPEPTAYHQ